MPVKKQAGGTKVSEMLSDGTYRVLNDHVIEKLLENCDSIDILSSTSLGAFLFKVKLRPGTIMLRSQVYGHSDDTSIIPQTRLTREEHEDTPENVSLGQQMHSFVIKFAFISKRSGYLDDKYYPPLKPGGLILNIGFTKAKATETQAKREASKQKFVHKKMLCWDGITPFSPDIISNEIMSSEKFRAMFSAAEIKQRNLGNLNFISVVDWIYAQLAKDPRLKVSLTVMDLVEGRTLAQEYKVLSSDQYSNVCLQAVAKMIILAMKCSACPTDLHTNNLMVVSVKNFLLIKRRVNVIDYGGVLILNDSYDYDIVVSKYSNFIMTGKTTSVDEVSAIIVPVTDLGLQEIESFFNMKNIRTTDSIDTKKTKIMRAFVAEIDFVRSFSKIENDSVLWSKVRDDNLESYSVMHRILMVISIIDILMNKRLQCSSILKGLYSHSGSIFNDTLSFYKKHNIDYSTELLTNPDLSNKFKALHKHLIETISECVLPIPSGVSALVASESALVASESALVAYESPPQKIQTLAPPDLFGYLEKHPIGVGGNSNRRRRTRRRVVALRHSIKRTNKRKNKRKYKNKK